MAFHQFCCFCFGPLLCRPCCCSNQRARSPVGQTLPCHLCWEACTESWSNSEKLVVLVFVVVYHFLLVLFSRLASFLPRPNGASCYPRINSSHVHLLFTGSDDNLSRWSESCNVLLLDWVTPVTQAALEVTWLSPGKARCTNALIKWRGRGGKRC